MIDSAARDANADQTCRTAPSISDQVEQPHYAIQVRYRYERVVERMLQLRGLSPFVPVYKKRQKWSDRIVEIEIPLFPGYVFCPLNLANRLPVLSAPGVISIVGAGKQPLPIDPSELEAVRAMVLRGTDVQPCRVSLGQRVRIASGPLKGIEGTLVQMRGKDRLVVSISLLNRSISATIDGAEAIPV